MPSSASSTPLSPCTTTAPLRPRHLSFLQADARWCTLSPPGGYLEFERRDDGLERERRRAHRGFAGAGRRRRHVARHWRSMRPVRRCVRFPTTWPVALGRGLPVRRRRAHPVLRIETSSIGREHPRRAQPVADHQGRSPEGWHGPSSDSSPCRSRVSWWGPGYRRSPSSPWAPRPPARYRHAPIPWRTVAHVSGHWRRVPIGRRSSAHRSPSPCQTGWANYEDLPGNFSLLPPGGSPESAAAATSDSIGIVQGVGVGIPEGTDCDALMPGVGHDAASMAAAYKAYPGIIASDAVSVEVGGLTGIMIELTYDPASDAGCQPSDLPHRIRPFLVGTGPAALNPRRDPGHDDPTVSARSSDDEHRHRGVRRGHVAGDRGRLRRGHRQHRLLAGPG